MSITKSYLPGLKVTVRDLKTNTEKLDLTPDIVSVVTSKAYGRAFGTWQLQTTFRQTKGGTYDQLLNANDIVLIEMDAGAGAGLVPVMLGLIDRAARSISFTPEGNPHRAVTISGRDAGKLFMQEIGWDVSGSNLNSQNAYGLDNINSSLVRRYNLACGSPKGLVRQLFEIWREQIPGNYYQRYVDDYWVTTDDDWMTYSPTLVGVRGTSFWDACMRASNSPWNILFCDTDAKGQFHLGLAPRPYQDNGRLALDSFHEVDGRDIATEDLGKSDIERVNLLCHWPPNYAVLANSQIDIALADKNLTKIDRDSVKENGVFAHIIEPIFVPKNFYLADNSMLDDSDDAIKRAEVYWGWYRNNHTYESGTCQIHLRPEIRAGDGLLNLDTGMEYQVQQVVHNYAYEPLYCRTTLSLVRGQKHLRRNQVSRSSTRILT